MEREIGKGKEGKEWKEKERKLTGDGDRDWQTNGDGKEIGKGKETGMGKRKMQREFKQTV